MTQVAVTMDTDNPSKANHSIARTPGFFDTEDTVRLGKIYLRLFFNKVEFQHFVYIREDMGNVDNASDSFRSISACELPEVIGIVERLLRELDSTIGTTATLYS